MIGEPGNERCYFCGGKLKFELATIPFVVDSSVIIVKKVPAEVCVQCGETIMSSEVAANLDGLLKQSYQLGFEVSILTYEETALIPA